MSLADGAGRHDEAKVAGREAALVRVGGDGRVEECRRLDGVLVCEVGTDEVRPVRGDPDAGREAVRDELEVLPEGGR